MSSASLWRLAFSCLKSGPSLHATKHCYIGAMLSRLSQLKGVWASTNPGYRRARMYERVTYLLEKSNSIGAILGIVLGLC